MADPWVICPAFDSIESGSVYLTNIGAYMHYRANKLINLLNIPLAPAGSAAPACATSLCLRPRARGVIRA
ncbi:hypothetical protein, partial [Cereibacter sphaeroides]|uniref:hypothetical protein n=1 Tax=Cereibacter sphaeroides TaxID=1063 RepID=UPI001B357505